MNRKYSTFKDRYDNDEVFRARHLANMNEKVACECGFNTSRSNLSRHRKTRNHSKRLSSLNAKLTKDDLVEVRKELIRLRKIIDKQLK